MAFLYKRTKLSDPTTSAECSKDTDDEAVVDQSAYSGKGNLDEIINADELCVLTTTNTENSLRNTASLVQDDDKHDGLMAIDEYPDFPLPADNNTRTSTVNLSSLEEPTFELEDVSAEESESSMTDLDRNSDLLITKRKSVILIKRKHR